MFVKICGMTRAEDALAAVCFGASALGFVFAPSRRYVHPERARSIITLLPVSVRTVGVFMNQSPKEVASIVAATGVDAIQLHGEEKISSFTALGKPIIKRVSVFSNDTPQSLHQRLKACHAAMALVDPGAGDGRSLNWALLSGIDSPFILAGGLTPQNVRFAVGAACPWGVDVASGVEHSPGIKDSEKMKHFIKESTWSKQHTAGRDILTGLAAGSFLKH